MPAEPSRDDRLVWIDLEMTGLDVARHAIVEIGVLVTDAELRTLDDGLDLVVHQTPEALALMDDVVRTMHTKSGLIAEVEASPLSLEEAGSRVLEYLRRHVPEPRTAPLCGNTIGMDRRFLALHLPEVEAHLHYRSIDVSSIKELCRRWYPELYRHRPNKTEAHRALGDIRESVDELRFYREKLFVPPPSRPRA